MPLCNFSPRYPAWSIAPWKSRKKCCGAGGAFFVNYSDLSSGIRKKKLDDIGNTGADVVISQCPGCRSYISAGMNKNRKTLHPITLLRRAYGL